MTHPLQVYISDWAAPSVSYEYYTLETNSGAQGGGERPLVSIPSNISWIYGDFSECSNITGKHLTSSLLTVNTHLCAPPLVTMATYTHSCSCPPLPWLTPNSCVNNHILVHKISVTSPTAQSCLECNDGRPTIEQCPTRFLTTMTASSFLPFWAYGG